MLTGPEVLMLLAATSVAALGVVGPLVWLLLRRCAASGGPP